MRRYRTIGAGAGLVRVEVLVPPEDRREILEHAARLRAARRHPAEWSERLAQLHALAMERFGARCLWNAAPSKTLEGMKAIAERLRAYGGMDAWRVAADIRSEIERATR